jgi:hypothetical protein
MKIAQVIDSRRNGKSVEDSVMEVFKKPEPVEQPQEQAPQMTPEEMMGALGGGAPQAAPGEGAPVAAQGPETMGGAPVVASPGAPAPSIQDILAQLGG